MYQVEITRKPKSTIFIKGSIPVEDFDVHIKSVTQKFVADAELPGFRKGKAPEQMVLEKIGEATLLEEAAEEALRKTYPAILKEHTIDAIGQPQIHITKLARGNALEFETETAVFPEVLLPDYKEIAKTKNAEPPEDMTISNEEVQKAIEWLQKSRGNQEQAQNQNTEENSADSAKKDKQVHPLTDEFAQSVGNFKTAEELTNTLRENMVLEKQEKAKEKRRVELLNTITGKTSTEIPDILIEAEKKKMIAELKNGIASMGMEWNTYLDHIKKTEEDITKELGKDAEQRVSHSLVLREIAEKEHIEPTEDECNTWTYRYLTQLDETAKKEIDVARVAEYAYGILRNQKVFEYLEKINE